MGKSSWKLRLRVLLEMVVIRRSLAAFFGLEEEEEDAPLIDIDSPRENEATEDRPADASNFRKLSDKNVFIKYCTIVPSLFKNQVWTSDNGIPSQIFGF